MILTRPAVADDRAFIVSGWSSSYRASRDCTTPMALYAKQKHEEIEFYLERCSVLVAHGELGVLMGFIAFDPATYVRRVGRSKVTLYGYILYVYVAEPFRGRKIARRLFEAAGINPSQRFGFHCTTRSSGELRSKIPLAMHDPYRARYEETVHVRSRTAEATEAGGREGAGADSGPEDLAP